MSAKVERLEAQLEKAYERLKWLTTELSSADARAARQTIDDPGAVSGIRRKPNQKADARRYDAYAKAPTAQLRLDHARNDVTRLTRALDAARADETRTRYTAQDVKGATHVKDANGWHKVVTVNRTTVSVETGYSWTDRVPLDRILQVHRDGAS